MFGSLLRMEDGLLGSHDRISEAELLVREFGRLTNSSLVDLLISCIPGSELSS